MAKCFLISLIEIDISMSESFGVISIIQISNLKLQLPVFTHLSDHQCQNQRTLGQAHIVWYIGSIHSYELGSWFCVLCFTFTGSSVVFPGCLKLSDTFDMPCRLHHTFSALSDGRVFVFGGRLSPAKPMCDTQILSLCLSADGWSFFYPDALIV